MTNNQVEKHRREGMKNEEEAKEDDTPTNREEPLVLVLRLWKQTNEKQAKRTKGGPRKRLSYVRGAGR